MNIMMLLTPKMSTGWIYDDFSLRQAVEKITRKKIIEYLYSKSTTKKEV